MPDNNEVQIETLEDGRRVFSIDIDTSIDIETLQKIRAEFENAVQEIKTLKNDEDLDKVPVRALEVDIEDDREYFRQKYKNELNPEAKEKYLKQLAMLEDAIVVYRLNTPPRE